MDSRSDAALSRSWVGAKADARGRTQSPIEALRQAIRRIGDASADAERMQTQAHKDWPALRE